MTQYKYDDTMKFRFTKNEHNEYHSFDDKPSLEYLDDSIISWHKNGVLHRIDKPALIRTLINGYKLEEYYNDGKLHSPNINIPACIDNKEPKYYYMGEELIKKYMTSQIIFICSVCKNVPTYIDYNNTFYNKIFNKIYCIKCNKLNELETIDFEIKLFSNGEFNKPLNGGFNKQNYVPEYLCNYIGLIMNEKKSRPEVTKLLNSKFNEYGLIKIKKDDDGKEFRVIILDKTAAKTLHRKEGYEIRCKDIQIFISEFYKDFYKDESI